MTLRIHETPDNPFRICELSSVIDTAENIHPSYGTTPPGEILRPGPQNSRLGAAAWS